MNRDLKPYPEYKDSGVPWLGKVPAHWGMKRGKNLFRCVDVRSETGEEELLTVSSERGVVPRRSANVTMFKAESYVGHKLCWPGDLVINSLWAWARGLGVSQFRGIVSTAYGVYRVRQGGYANPKFIHELVRSIPFNWELRVRSKGVWTSRLQLTDDSFLDAPFPLPPLPEQSAIVRFLDHVDRKIKKYIRAKQKLIKLLEEQKQAIIHRAVTRGLDPNVRLKPSGVEWLGDVPEHWEVLRQRNVVQLLVSSVDKHNKEGEIPVRLCNYVDVYKNERITEHLSFMPATATSEEARRFRLTGGDVLITKDSEAWNDIGVPSLVEYSASDLVCGYHLAILRPHDGVVIGGFLLRALQSPGVASQYFVSANGVTRYGLSHDAIKSVLLAIPPLDEQTAIISYLDNATSHITSAIDHATREISLLREYRTRLIADVVTGKLDVREAAANLPEEAEEAEVLDESEAQTEGGEDGDAGEADAAAEETES
jgi:type I restriction enzyme S subunit